MAIELLITRAGLDALVNAEASETEMIKIISVGLSEQNFTMAPTIDALPGEFKRITAVSGTTISQSMIHMTAQDVSTDIYDLRGIGLFLEDGTLFAVYSQPTPIFRKVSIASFMIALDIAFANGGASEIVFGDATFLMPPATELMKGVARIATLSEVAAGENDDRIVTPAKLATRLAEFGEDVVSPVLSGLSEEAALREAGDNDLGGLIAAITDRLNGSEFARMPHGNFADKGHIDFPVAGQEFRLNWGKKDVAAKTASTDIYDAPYAICFGVFQGGGTSDPNNVDAVRAYPGSGQQALTHVNLTNGTAGLLTLHWFAIGLAA